MEASSISFARIFGKGSHEAEAPLRLRRIMPGQVVQTMRRSLDTIAIATVLLLCASWGLQQVAVKMALPTFPPMIQMGIRSAGAVAMVLLWCVVTGRGQLLNRDGTLGGVC
jgi:hypothetical protein